jgi:hypothetical protein
VNHPSLALGASQREDDVMRVRHKIPSIFNLSMVDVLCCALGCVILMWLVNLRVAKTREDETAAEAKLADDKASKAAARVAGAEKERDDAFALILDLDGQLDQLRKENEEVKKNLSSHVLIVRDQAAKLKAADDRVQALQLDVAAGEKKAKDLEARIVILAGDLAKTEKAGKETLTLADVLRADLKKAQDDLKREKDAGKARDGELADARLKLSREQELNREMEKDLEKRRKELKEAQFSLEDLLARRRALEAQLADARGFRDKWEASRARIAELEGQLNRLKGEGDKLFAGMPLTGKRVVFVIDTSGSMHYVRGEEKDPEKWPGVTDTVARVMRSLPELEKFQVITFAETLKYPLGSPGKWLDFDPKQSPEQVLAALRDPKITRVEGGTNLFISLEQAFKFRAAGLDTVYLFSDGIPNEGPGVPKDQMEFLIKTKQEVELGRRLGDHILKVLRTDWNPPRDGKTSTPVRINTIGFFYDSPDCGSFLWALARSNNGNFVGMSKP